MTLALVTHGPDDLRVEERDDPVPGSGEAVLEVAACGICGTDLRIAAGQHRAYADDPRRVPGHEISGTVVAAGPGAGVTEGTRAVVAPNVGCGVCRQCRAGRVNLCERPSALGITRDGGFTERLLLGRDVIERGNVLPVADGVDLVEASLTEPLACALRGSAACRIAPGDVVLIVGAGPIGLLHLIVARLSDPAVVIVSEMEASRREQASGFGADRVVDPGAEDLAEVVAEVSGGAGADVIITAAPAAAAQRQSLELAAPAARINFFGGLPKDASRVDLDTNLIHYKELVVTGTTANTNEDCRRAIDLIEAGKIPTGRLVDSAFPLRDADLAFAEAASGNATKVVIAP